MEAVSGDLTSATNPKGASCLLMNIRSTYSGVHPEVEQPRLAKTDRNCRSNQANPLGMQLRDWRILTQEKGNTQAYYDLDILQSEKQT